MTTTGRARSLTSGLQARPSRPRSAWAGGLIAFARTLTCAAVLAVCCEPSLAAEPGTEAESPSTRVTPEARAKFDRGVRAYEAGRFREAADLFHEADRLEPSALLSFNIAKAYERMGDEPKALAAYREYLRRLPQAENRLATSRRIAELELALQARGVQQLTVLSEPSGATLLVDGVAQGVTPWTGELVPGAHRLGLRLRAHLDVAREIELPARTAIDVRLQLEPEPEPPAPEPAETVPVIEKRSMPSSVPQATDAVRPRWWTWALVGGTGALLVGSLGAELSRRAAEDGAREADDQFAYKREFDSMESRQTLARVLLGVGLAAGVASGLSLYFDLARSEPLSPDVGLALDATGGRVTLRSRW